MVIPGYLRIHVTHVTHMRMSAVGGVHSHVSAGVCVCVCLNLSVRSFLKRKREENTKIYSKEEVTMSSSGMRSTEARK